MTASSDTGSVSRRVSDDSAFIPGILLSGGVAAAATAIDTLQAHLMGRSWLEALVLAIILGAIVRTSWTPGCRYQAGIKFCAKTLLEIAVMMLGATISAHTVMAAGPALIAGTVLVVGVSLSVSFAIGRLLGLSARMATLIACGNSICGNSAIAVVAPVIGASARDVATSIAFTAVLGVAVVVGLPLLAVTWGMPAQSFGILAGLTVYAVPQVLAATAPVSSLSAQIGTLVKLVRVLMLGPIVLGLSLFVRLREGRLADGQRMKHRLPLHELVPWFIVGFLLLMAARSSGIVPAMAIEPVTRAASLLTIISMAGLGLGVDIRAVAQAGMRASAVVTLSLISLGAIALLLIHILDFNQISLGL